LSENCDGILRDWPRVPLPTNRAALEASAALGGRIAALLDTEQDAPGVTSGNLSPMFRSIAIISMSGGGQLDAGQGDLSVDAGWGHLGKDGVTMPGTGKTVERAFSDDEQRIFDGTATGLGNNTRYVYLNEVTYWQNIPQAVWEYR